MRRNSASRLPAPEDGWNHRPKHVELIGIINKPILLHLVGYLYYLYQWCTVKQISNCWINRKTSVIPVLIIASCSVFSGACMCEVLNAACMCVSVLCISAILQLKGSSLYIFLPFINSLFSCIYWFLCWPHTAKQGLLSLLIITGFNCTNTRSTLTFMLYLIETQLNSILLVIVFKQHCCRLCI